MSIPLFVGSSIHLCVGVLAGIRIDVNHHPCSQDVPDIGGIIIADHTKTA